MVARRVKIASAILYGGVCLGTVTTLLLSQPKAAWNAGARERLFDALRAIAGDLRTGDNGAGSSNLNYRATLIPSRSCLKSLDTGATAAVEPGEQVILEVFPANAQTFPSRLDCGKRSRRRFHAANSPSRRSFDLRTHRRRTMAGHMAPLLTRCMI